jgi:hypothetical protein
MALVQAISAFVVTCLVAALASTHPQCSRAKGDGVIIMVTCILYWVPLQQWHHECAHRRRHTQVCPFANLTLGSVDAKSARVRSISNQATQECCSWLLQPLGSSSGERMGCVTYYSNDVNRRDAVKVPSIGARYRAVNLLDNLSCCVSRTPSSWWLAMRQQGSGQQPYR